MGNKPLKLHLGCGGKYLEGYVNIDFPPSERTIANVRADIYKDIRDLEYKEASIDEIRSHHLFEHFSRADALKFLLEWRYWLKVGGKLVIETPDYFWSSLIFPFVPQKFKLRIGRHIFGSQEDTWANHLDFWYKRKFKKVLSRIGFEQFRFFHPVYRNFLPNIKVECIRGDENIDEKAVIKEILSGYILPAEDKEKFLKNWLTDNSKIHRTSS